MEKNINFFSAGRINTVLCLIEEEMGWQNRVDAYLALKSVLQAFRDRYSPDEALTLGLQLPFFLQKIYFDNWVVSERINSKKEFINKIGNQFFLDYSKARYLIRIVLKAVGRVILTSN